MGGVKPKDQCLNNGTLFALSGGQVVVASVVVRCWLRVLVSRMLLASCWFCLLLLVAYWFLLLNLVAGLALFAGLTRVPSDMDE